jgi:hypothetical protein
MMDSRVPPSSIPQHPGSVALPLLAPGWLACDMAARTWCHLPCMYRAVFWCYRCSFAAAGFQCLESQSACIPGWQWQCCAAGVSSHCDCECRHSCSGVLPLLPWMVPSTCCFMRGHVEPPGIGTGASKVALSTCGSELWRQGWQQQVASGGCSGRCCMGVLVGSDHTPLG